MEGSPEPQPVKRGSSCRDPSLVSVLTCLVLCAPLVLSPPAARTQGDATSADARLRALYTEEWNWRQHGAGAGRRPARRGGRERPLPQGRCRVATGATRVLDQNPRDPGQHPVRPALAGREGERAGLPHLDPRARQRREIPDLRGAVQQRHLLLDRVHAAPGPRHAPRRIARISARLRDVPRYFDEQIANMRAGLARGFTVPRVSVVGRDATIEPYLKGDTTNPLYAAVRPRCRRRSPRRTRTRSAPKRRRVIRDIVAPAYDRLLTFMRTSTCPRPARRSPRSAMPDGEAYYQAMIEKFTTLKLTASADPRHRPEGGRAHRGRDGGDQRAGGLQGHDGGVLPLPAHRSAVLREDAARAAVVLGVRRRRRPT